MSPETAKKRTGCLKYAVLVLALAVVAGLMGRPRKQPYDESLASAPSTGGPSPTARLTEKGTQEVDRVTAGNETTVMREEATPKPVKDEISTEPPAKVASPEPPMPSISGLMPVDVYGNLTSKGFTKTGPKMMPDGLFVIDCKRVEADASYFVEIWMKGNAVRSVIVNATSDAGDPRRVVGVLSLVATIPYDGSQPSDAKEWVEETIGSDGKRTFGPAVYRLWTNPGGHMTELRIDAKGYEPK